VSEVDWSRYNLPAISSLIADVDVCDGADRVLAWEGLASSVRDQHTRLLAAADSLAAVWPPGKNDSALEFQRQVKGLADSMQETLKKAEDTRAGLNGVVQAFSTAQSKVRDLAAGREGVANDWMPRMVDHAEDKYDEHAQAAIREAEAAIADHGTQIQAPSLFQIRPFFDDDDGHHLTGDDGSSTGHSVGGSGGSGSGRTGLSADPRPVPIPVDPNSMVPPDTPGTSAGGPGSGGDGIGSGPVLSGIAPAPSPTGGLGGPPAGPLGTLPVGTPPPATSPIGSGGGPGGLGVLPIGGGAVGPGVRPFGAVPGGVGGSGARRPVSVRRGLPSGAVIGEDSERGIANSRSQAGAMPMTGGMGGRGETRSGQTVNGDADQQWETDEGVVPVIKPDTTPVRHDPGPGVIGFNR
jgi:hypothetical protein